jgi:putative endonuclease
LKQPVTTISAAAFHRQNHDGSAFAQARGRLSGNLALSGTFGARGDAEMNAKDALGRQGEQLAADYLTTSGLEILARNWRCSQGEIDIVAADGRVLVVCEVKTRSGVRYGTPLEAITRPKARRLRRLAALWLVTQSVLFDEIRIDVVGVLRNGPGQFSIEHVRGVG